MPLGGAGSVGYGWQVTADGDASAVEEHIEAAAAPGQGPPGGSAAQALRIVAVHAGNVTLHLRLVRSFQPDRPPLQVVEVRVEVRD